MQGAILMQMAPFESASELQNAHTDLLELLDEQLGPDANAENEAAAVTQLEPKIMQFLERGAATGIYLEEIKDRTSCQVLLDYWVSSLSQAGIAVSSMRLAQFDGSKLPDLKDKTCPYVGLDAFQKQEYFFGREADTQELLTQVHKAPLVVVLGASGSGKSSLVMGGVLPALKASFPKSELRVVPPFVPGNAVLEGLTGAALSVGAGGGVSIAERVAQLRQDSSYLFQMIGGVDAPPLLITIDQFEEVFTLASPKDREALAANLAQLLKAGRGHRVLLTVREEFRSRIVELQDLIPYLDKAWYSMRPMSYDELKAAVERPAALVNLQFQTGIVDDLVKKVLGQPAALPLLQFTLRSLWDKRDRNRITWEVYKKVGDPLTALQVSADQFYDRHVQQTQDEAKRILLELVRVDELLETYRQPVLRSHLREVGKADTEGVLNLLAENDYVRITSSLSGTDAVVELKHESLIRNWPRFVSWIEDKRRHRRQRLAIAQAADRWMKTGKPQEGLLTGWQIQEVRDEPDLSAVEREFVEASAEAVDRIQREKAAAQLRTQRRTIGGVAIVIVMIISLGAALISWSNSIIAEDAKKIAEDERNKAKEAKQRAEEDRNKAEQAEALATRESNKAKEAKQRAEEDRNKAEQAEALATRARTNADVARTSAEEAQRETLNLSGFLIGEQFLGEIRDMGRSELLELVSQRVQRYETTQWQGTALFRGLAFRNVGDLQKMRGQTTDSLASFKQSLLAIESSPETTEREREAARTHQRLGEVLTDAGQVSKALAHYEKAVEYWRHFSINKMGNDYPRERIDLADSLISVAYLKGHMGKAGPAAKDLSEAITIVSGVIFGHQMPDGGLSTMASEVASYPDSKALEVLSNAIMSQGQLYPSENFEEVATLARQASLLRPSSTLAKRNAYVARAQRGNARLAKPQQALTDYQAAQAELNELRRVDPDNQIWQREEAAIRLLIAEGILACFKDEPESCKSVPSIQDAEVESLEAIATFRVLTQIDPGNISLQRDLGWALSTYAKVLSKLNQQPKRLEQLSESERLYENSLVDSVDVENHMLLANVLLDKADALASLGSSRHKEVLDTLGRATTLLKNVEDDSTDHIGYAWGLSESYGREIKIRQDVGDNRGSDIAKSNQQHLTKRFEELTGDWQFKIRELNKEYDNHFKNGKQSLGKDDYNTALHEFGLAELAVRKALILQPANYFEYDKLRNVLGEIQLVFEKLKKLDQRINTLAALMHAAQIASWLVSEKEKKELVRSNDENLRQARRDLGIVLNDNKRFDEALAVVQEEAIVAFRLLNTDPNNAVYLERLGNAKCGKGRVLRGSYDASPRAGWEEALRICLNYIEKAAEIDKRNHKYPKESAEWREYLADELLASGSKEKALAEYRIALDAYRLAATLSPGDVEVRNAIRQLEERVAH